MRYWINNGNKYREGGEMKFMELERLHIPNGLKLTEEEMKVCDAIAQISEELKGPMKRTRRSEDQMLTDTITALYEKIQGKISKIKDDTQVVDEIFEALSPLRILYDDYKGIDTHHD